MVTSSSKAEPIYQYIRPGDFVVVDEKSSLSSGGVIQWWIARILFVVSGARQTCSNSIFQVVDIDTGHVKYINAEDVTHVVKHSRD